MKIQWAVPFRFIGGNAAGYTGSSINLRKALQEIGVEITDSAKTVIHYCHPSDCFPVNGKRNVLFCLEPGTRLLTSDLRWVKIEDLHLGDELIAPDECLGRKAKMRRSRVTGLSKLVAPRLKITTDKGEVICSPNHKWATRSKGRKYRKQQWVKSENLRVGDFIAYYTEPWEGPSSYNDGWMAGFLDGEGYVANANDKGTNVGFAQNPGKVLDQAHQILMDDGFEMVCYRNQKNINNNNKGCVQTLIRGPGANLRVLGKYRPARLLEKSYDIWENKAAVHKGTRCATILKIEEIGEGTVWGIATTTRTVVAEGMLSHNTMYESKPVPEIFKTRFKQVDAILTPTNFCKDLFEPYRAKKPLLVSKLGFDNTIFTYTDRQWDMTTPFQWLWLGSPNGRHGWGQVVRTWSNLFADKSFCHLMMKTSSETGEGHLKHIGNITFDNRMYSFEEIRDLYHTAHGFLHPVQGAGFSLPIAEAMATGLPTIATSYGGQSDFFDSQVGWVVKHQFKHIPMTNGDTFVAACADTTDLGRQMLEIMDDYPAALARAKRGADRMHTKWTWQNAARQLAKNLERLGYDD